MENRQLQAQLTLEKIRQNMLDAAELAGKIDYLSKVEAADLCFFTLQQAAVVEDLDKNTIDSLCLGIEVLATLATSGSDVSKYYAKYLLANCFQNKYFENAISHFQEPFEKPEQYDELKKEDFFQKAATDIPSAVRRLKSIINIEEYATLFFTIASHRKEDARWAFLLLLKADVSLYLRKITEAEWKEISTHYYLLGRCYAEGYGTVIDKKWAVSYFIKALAAHQKFPSLSWTDKLSMLQCWATLEEDEDFLAAIYLDAAVKIVNTKEKSKFEEKDKNNEEKLNARANTCWQELFKKLGNNLEAKEIYSQAISITTESPEKIESLINDINITLQTLPIEQSNDPLVIELKKITNSTLLTALEILIKLQLLASDTLHTSSNKGLSLFSMLSRNKAAPIDPVIEALLKNILNPRVFEEKKKNASGYVT